MTAYDVISHLIGFNADTNKLVWAAPNAISFAKAGVAKDRIPALLKRWRHKHGSPVALTPSDKKGGAAQVRFVLDGRTIRAHAGLVVWHLLTGETPQGDIVYRDGNDTNLDPHNILLTNRPTSKVLHATLDGIYTNDTSEGKRWRSILRYADDGVTRSVTSDWATTERGALLMRRDQLRAHGLWSVSRLADYVG